MSLINDMLRDLSARQAASPVYAISDGVIAGEQEQLSQFFGRSKFWPIIVLSLILFVLVFISIRWLSKEHYLFGNQAPSGISSQVETPMDVPLAIESTPVSNLTTQLQNQINTSDATEESMYHPTIAEPVTSREQDSSTGIDQKVIYQLIDKASRALALDRLTSPEDDNA